MKIERKDSGFQPVVITLESEEEVEKLKMGSRELVGELLGGRVVSLPPSRLFRDLIGGLSEGGISPCVNE